jgi:23S rRNA pseudouridine2605 synthase
MATDKKSNGGSNYFEKTFTPQPKEKKMTNKEFNKMPSAHEVEGKGDEKEPKVFNNISESKRERTFKTDGATQKPFGERRSFGDKKPYNNDRNREGGERKSYGDRKPFNSESRNNEGGERRPYNNDGGERKPYNNDRNRGGGERKSYGDRKPFNSESRNNEGGERRPYNNDGGDKKPYNNDRNREGGERKSYGDRKPFNSESRNNEGGERRPYNNDGGDRKPYNNDRNREGGERKSYGDRKPFNSDRRNDEGGERRPYNNDGGDRKPYNNDRNREGGERKSYSDRKPYNNDRNNDGTERRAYNNDGGDRKPYNNDRNREGGERKSYGDRKPFNSDRRNDEGGELSPYNNEGGDRKPYNNDRNREGGERKSYGDRKPFNSDRRNDEGGERRPYNKDGGDRKPHNNDRNREGAERKSYGDRKPYNNDRNNEGTERRAYNNDGGDRKPYNNDRSREEGYGDRKPFNSDRNRDGGERKSYNNDRGDRPTYNDRNREGGERKSYDDRKSNTGFSRNNYDSRGGGNSSNFMDRKKEEWKEKDEAARKEYSERGGYKGKPENKIEGYADGGVPKKKFNTPYVNARGDMYQDDHIESSHNKLNARLEEEELRADEQMPLNKYIAHCGICSRREAAEIVKNGRILVNEKVEINPAYRVEETDIVMLDGKKIVPQETQIYVLLNKPKDFITTSDDPEGRKTVMDLVATACEERIYPVGRLDRNTSGLLLLTNDGELANKLSHPKYRVQKLYQVGLDVPLTKEHYQQIIDGLELEDGKAEVDELEYTDLADDTKIGIQIHSGKNRIVRRIFEHLGYEVKTLDRVMYANLTKKNLPRGNWRYLNATEIKFLKHFNSND